MAAVNRQAAGQGKPVCKVGTVSRTPLPNRGFLMSLQDTGPGMDGPEQVDAQLEHELAQQLEGHDIDRLMDQAMATDASKDEPSAHTSACSGPELVRGRIVAVQADDVFVDLHGLGGKDQGVVPLGQFERSPRIGSVMDFVVESRDPSQGLVTLSREGAVGRATWDQLCAGRVVEARVTATNAGGLELEMVGGIRAFMPASQVDLLYVKDLQSFVGQKLHAQIHKVDRRAKKLVLNRRGLLESQLKAQRQRLWDELDVGQMREGKVTGVADYGVFVDLGGLDGLVHVSDMSHDRVDKPSDLVSSGDTVTVKVLKIDREKERISLGLKQAQPDPWQGLGDRVRGGDRLTGRVVRITDFGAFVEVEPGVEGLVHISELAKQHIDSVSDVLSVGQVQPFRVLSVDVRQHRIRLSMKAVDEPATGGPTGASQGSKRVGPKPSRPLKGGIE